MVKEPIVPGKLREEIRSEAPGVFELADELLSRSQEMAQGTTDFGKDHRDTAWIFWNVGFLVGGSRLFRATLTLGEAGLAREAEMPARSLLELVANQSYMAADPPLRAAEFLHEANAAKERLLERMSNHGLTGQAEFDEIDAAITAESLELAKAVGEPLGEYSYRPFNKSAKERITQAGMIWHYDLFFMTASDTAHMSAAAVERLMHWGENGLTLQAVDHKAAGVIIVAEELMIRLFYGAAKVINVGGVERINDVARKYCLLNGLEGDDAESLIASWRGDP